MPSLLESVSADRCHLLALPPELRLEIYEYIFERQTLHFYYWRALCGEARKRKGPRGIATLCTCRQLLAEAEPVFYNRTSFLLDCSRVTSNDWHEKTSRAFKCERTLKNITHMELYITPNGKNTLAPGLLHGSLRFESLDFLKIGMTYSGNCWRAGNSPRKIVLALRAIKTSPQTTIKLELRCSLDAEDSPNSTLARINDLLLHFNV